MEPESSSIRQESSSIQPSIELRNSRSPGTLLPRQIGQWERFEVTLRSPKEYSVHDSDVSLDVVFTRPDGSQFHFWGFNDGGTTWKFRCMPDQIGRWRWESNFSDGSQTDSGTFVCTASDIPGQIHRDEENPLWFGFKGSEHVLIRSFHVGDRFFAKNWDDPENDSDGNPRTAFLDWAQAQGYNMLSIASHYLNRDDDNRGRGWETPDLYPIDPAEFRRLELMLDDLSQRKIMVFPFAGFFGRKSDFPTDREEQDRFLRYIYARFGAYWNILLNLGGPEPNLSGNGRYLSEEEIEDLGHRIQEINVFDHLLTMHNRTGRDPYRDSDWSTYGTVQGPKTTNRERLSEELLASHHPEKPLYAQETLWGGNTYGHPAYSEEDIRKNAYVINLSAAALNFGDMQGSSSSGFSGNLDLSKRHQEWHDIVKMVWDFFETIPFYQMKPRQDLVDNGFCLAEEGREYLIYLEKPGSVKVQLPSGKFKVEWIDAQATSDRRDAGTVEGESNLQSPEEGDDWLLHLVKQP